MGQPVGSGLIQQNKEQPFFENLADRTGLSVSVEYRPVDVTGIPDTDGLRVLKSGLFDIVSIRGPQVSRDEVSILGFDLIGLNTSYKAGKAHTEAFFDTVDARIQQNFNAKLLGVWPAGPQVVFCKPEIGGLSEPSRPQGPSRRPKCCKLRRGSWRNRCSDAVWGGPAIACPRCGRLRNHRTGIGKFPRDGRKLPTSCFRLRCNWRSTDMPSTSIHGTG